MITLEKQIYRKEKYSQTENPEHDENEGGDIPLADNMTFSFYDEATGNCDSDKLLEEEGVEKTFLFPSIPLGDNYSCFKRKQISK